MPRFPQLLDARHMLLLRAALGEGQSAIDAYQTWRASEKPDDFDDTVYRLMPLLIATAQRAAPEDPDILRMRGMVKHIWLRNMLRIRDLAEAKAVLDGAGIDVLLIKGGALFARYEELVGLHAAGDYDLQVRRADASRAIEALTQASFRSLGMRPELFLEPDFDRNIHAVAMTKATDGRALDLHWRPLIRLHQKGLIDELFAHAETAELFGQSVRIPGLADHLFLAAARPEPWQMQEILFRAVEMAHLLRSCGGKLDWPRFEAAVARYGRGWIAAPLLALIRDEVGASVPAGLAERIWRNAMPGKTIEFSIRRSRSEQRSPWENFLLAFIESLRSEFRQGFSWQQLLSHPQFLFRAFADSEIEFPILKTRALRRLWSRYAKSHPPVGGIAFSRGFSIPEQGGRWTDAEFAVIEVAVDVPEHATVAAKLSIVPFLPPGAGPFKFDIFAGVGGPRHVELTSGDPMPFPLELDALAVGEQARKIVIALRMPDLRRPREIGHSVDPRLLGLFVESVVVGDRINSIATNDARR